MPADEVFEAISHPLRIKVLKLLAAKPRSFSELKRELGVESSGKLDFHLKKMEGLVALDEEGKYTLTKEGYAALQAVETIKKHGWQRRAYFLNLAAFILVNAYTAVKHPSLWLAVILPVTGAWIAFYSYWSIVKRKIFKAL
ncbi:MAG: helix-turn-helix transcriptional regulator [Candidatus Verstraetearchaeota archaeon]|nr:helix-turn-helix transcriptional regulator [Candidatus Verstraetearchaeota archaeon]